METPEKTPAIFVVATPIGNLEDVSIRMTKTLKNVDIILAEDTRVTKKLLNHIGVDKKEVIANHDHNEETVALKILDRIEESNETVAIVSDAGTPCISDPGYRLIAEAKKRGIKVHPIPGPSALTSLASAAGLPTNRILFLGFLPPKQNALRQEIESWLDLEASIVFYESTRRLEKTLKLISEIYPHAMISIGRELTKLFEEIETFTINEALYYASSHTSLKGELTAMVNIGSKKSREKTARASLDLDSMKVEAAKAFKKGGELAGSTKKI